MNILSSIKHYKGESNFAISNIIGSAVSFFSGVLAAAYIDPEDLGVMQAVLLVSTYCSFLHLGIFNGINRNLAYYKAQGDTEKMQRQIDTSYTTSLIVGGIGLVIGVGVLLLFIWMNKSSVYLLSAFYLIIALVFTPLTNHVENTYRSGQQFGRLGNIKNIQSVVYFIFSFLPIALGFIGRVLTQVINIVFGYVLRIIKVPYKHKGHGDIDSFKELVATGAPLMIGGYIWSVFSVSDKTFVAEALTTRDLGLYTLSGYCMTLLMVIPNALNTLLYPKAAARYGSTGDKHALLSFWYKSMLLYAVVLLPVCVLVWFALPFCVEYFMPKYVEGVTAARITLLTCLTFVSLGPSVIFGTLRKNSLYIITILFLLGLFWLITTCFKDYFTTIESVAWLRFLLSAGFALFIIVYSYYLVRK